MSKTFSVILLTTICSYGQFKPNSVGVAYLTSETKDQYSLTIALPASSLVFYNNNQKSEFRKVIDSTVYKSPITFFDSAGVLLTSNQRLEFKVEFWCDNDGGTQYRPTAKAIIKKREFKRPINAIADIQNIACFVLLNSISDEIEPVAFEGYNSIPLKGDYNNDGNPDCFI